MEVNRDRYLNKLIARKHNGLVKIITGVRRCGKSYLLFKIFKNHLLESGIEEKQIISIALDSEENRKYRDVSLLHKEILSLASESKMNYLLLDEIQLVNDFESLLNSLLRKDNLDIYVTGSNSKFLSSDIVTEFRGRGDEVKIRPLSFSEYYSVFDGDKTDALSEYMDYGGLPELLKFKSDEQKESYLVSIMKTTYLLDIIERNKIKRPYVMEILVDVLSSSVGSLINPTKIKNTLQTKGYGTIDEDTIVRYLGYLEDAFLFEKAKRYDVKGRKYIGALEKFYPIDHGISNARLEFRQTKDRPHIMESIVFNELRSRGYSIDIGIVSYTKTIDGKTSKINSEVDFIAKKGSSKLYVQSAYRMKDDEKHEQETRSLLKINDSFKKIVIVGDSMKPQMDEKGILYIGLIQFLIDENSLD